MAISLINRRGMIALSASAASVPFVRPSFGQSPLPVKIAVIVTLSGPFAAIGQNIKAGVDFAVEDVNAAGGIKALGGARLEIVAADAEDTVEKARNAAQRILAQEPNIIGGLGDALSGMTLVVTEMTEKAEIPWLTQTFADVLTARGYKYVFEIVPVASAQGAMALPTVMALAQASGANPKTVAVVADTNQALQAMVKIWRDGGYEKSGLKILSEQSYTPPIADATELIAGLRRNRPDILFVLPAALPDLKLMLDKLSELGMGRDVIPTFAVAGPSGSPELLTAAGAASLEGFFGIFSNWPGKKHASLVQRFMARTGKPWMNAQSLDGYGQIMVYREALERAGAGNARKVAEEIRKMDSKDGAADYFAGPLNWDAQGRRLGAGLVVAQWQGGQPVSVFPTETAAGKVKWPGK